MLHKTFSVRDVERQIRESPGFSRGEDVKRGQENPTMADRPVTPEPHPASPAAARAALHVIIDRMSDEEVTIFWRLICSWVAEGTPHGPAEQAAEQQR
jgi:hypothetical protein